MSALIVLYHTPGWMISVPIVLALALLVWALVDSSSTPTFDIEEDEEEPIYDWKEHGL